MLAVVKPGDRADSGCQAPCSLKSAGATNISLPPEELPPGGFGIHEGGTARMGRNLFVTDGSCMPSVAAQNPSLTFIALTARAANYAVQQTKVGAI